MVSTPRSVTGFCPERVHPRMMERGYRPPDPVAVVSLALADGQPPVLETGAAHGAGEGAFGGGLLGAVAAVGAVVQSSLFLASPALAGPVLAGPAIVLVAAALAGAVAGGAAGGLLGALLGWGWPHRQAPQHCSGGLQPGDGLPHQRDPRLVITRH